MLIELLHSDDTHNTSCFRPHEPPNQSISTVSSSLQTHSATPSLHCYRRHLLLCTRTTRSIAFSDIVIVAPLRSPGTQGGSPEYWRRLDEMVAEQDDAVSVGNATWSPPSPPATKFAARPPSIGSPVCCPSEDCLPPHCHSHHILTHTHTLSLCVCVCLSCSYDIVLSIILSIQSCLSLIRARCTTRAHKVPVQGNVAVQRTANSAKSQGPGESEYEKPPYSFPCLIGLALQSTPNGRMSVAQIYDYVMHHFPYFRTAKAGWKNSVRHNLSLNKVRICRFIAAQLNFLLSTQSSAHISTHT